MTSECVASGDAGLKTYNDADVVEYYRRQEGLQPGEAYVFEKYIHPNSDILDIGVGGGRTTPHLSKAAKRYVGIDYSSAMVDACRKRFPAIDFHTMDASEMSRFPDESFDVALFSFNGIDYLPTDVIRLKCLNEIFRVLKPDGLFIFSSHNARILGILPNFKDTNVGRKIWRTIRAVFKSVFLVVRAVSSKAFYRGHGYITDPIHGGILTQVTTPKSVVAEVTPIGFVPVEHVGADRIVSISRYLVPWYYYVFKKAPASKVVDK